MALTSSSMRDKQRWWEEKKCQVLWVAVRGHCCQGSSRSCQPLPSLCQAQSCSNGTVSQPVLPAHISPQGPCPWCPMSQGEQPSALLQSPCPGGVGFVLHDPAVHWGIVLEQQSCLASLCLAPLGISKASQGDPWLPAEAFHGMWNEGRDRLGEQKKRNFFSQHISAPSPLLPSPKASPTWGYSFQQDFRKYPCHFYGH